MTIADRFISRVTRRPPDKVIGGPDNPYLRRWYVIPRNRWCNVYLHQFLRSDDDRALHDHPWINCSILLRGDYIEHTPSGRFARLAGDVIFRRATAAHRIELVKHLSATVWTLFLTGPLVREWGFWCPQGWVHWKAFTAADDPGLIGKGCDA